MKGPRDLLLKFWDPLHMSGTVSARKFVFDMQIDYEGFLRKEIKIKSNGLQRGHVTYFSNFATPSISRMD